MINLIFETKSPMLPGFTISLFDDKLNIDVSDKLAKIVLNEKQNILDKTNKRDVEPDPNWLTGRLWDYNFLDFNYPEIEILKKFIYESYTNYMRSLDIEPEKKIYVQCWANILYNDGRVIDEHNHSDAHCNAPFEYSYISGNLSVQTENTNTYFCHPILPRKFRIPVKNINSELILFPSFLIHSTDGCITEKSRITISFDIITQEVYNMVDNKNFRELA